jgi:Holliday junction resolvase RusA-like endonuclease
MNRLDTVTFTVYGTPVAQGSMKAVMPLGAAHPRVLHTSNKKLKAWREDIGWRALEALNRAGLTRMGRSVAVSVEAVFYFRRPSSVTRDYMTVAPDIDKLGRAVLDALTGVVYEDDSQVVELVKRKLYDTRSRLEVTVRELMAEDSLLQRIPFSEPIKEKDIPF